MFILDMGGHDSNITHLKEKYPHAVITRFYSSYLDSIHRCVQLARTKFIWVIASCCDYDKFDFTWEPTPWEAYQIHCWASNDQMYGDTFLIPVDEFTQQNVIQLEWYHDINYHSDGVDRLPWPITVYDDRSLSQEIIDIKLQSEYHLFTPTYTNFPQLDHQPALWGAETHQIVSYSTNNSVNLVPRCAKSFIKTQVYDYPRIRRLNTISSDPLDIIYISNGEPDEEKWYNHTVKTSGREVKWIRGVNGRTAAYQAAAHASDTPWFLTVFAKLEVLPDFNWFWQPDYFQEHKHYIFNALNPLNGLEYGHQAMIAYHKNLVLNNNNPGIDFTLSQPHTVIPILSGIAHFNQDPWMTWRTAFREVIKLIQTVQLTPTIETEHRLKVWLTRAEGNHAEWCLKGANDAVDYYNSVFGVSTSLQKTFEWDFLLKTFDRYNAQQPR